MTTHAYRCHNCAAEYPDDYSVWRCACGAPLWSAAQPRLTRADLLPHEFSMWRYQGALPVTVADRRVSLGEGATPLNAFDWHGHPVWFKVEAGQPSGSFKDRGVALIVNHAALRGVRRLSEDSSGNAGSSFATYCAAAGIECEIHVPANTSSGKLIQIAAHGADVNLVDGPRDAAAMSAQSSGTGLYAGHNWHPLFIEGVATIALELWEQCGFTVPDQVVVPVGNGSLVLGLYRGFQILQRSGETNRMPRIIGVQSVASDSIHRRIHGLPGVSPVVRTVAEGIAIRATTHDSAVVQAILDTGGSSYSVTDEEIIQALHQAFEIGHFIEPTSAAALAGLNRLLADGGADSQLRTVVVLTGNGLKASSTIDHLIHR